MHKFMLFGIYNQKKKEKINFNKNYMFYPEFLIKRETEDDEGKYLLK